MAGFLLGAAGMFAVTYSTQAILPELGSAFHVSPSQAGLTISVVVLALSALRARGAVTRPRPLVPRFLILFVLASVLDTVGLIGPHARRALADAALALITTALAGVGLAADVGAMRRTGLRPLLLGAILWVSVATVSLLLQRATGQL